jgi:hypothetical protein
MLKKILFTFGVLSSLLLLLPGCQPQTASNPLDAVSGDNYVGDTATDQAGAMNVMTSGATLAGSVIGAYISTNPAFAPYFPSATAPIGGASRAATVTNNFNPLTLKGSVSVSVNDNWTGPTSTASPAPTPASASIRINASAALNHNLPITDGQVHPPITGGTATFTSSIDAEASIQDVTTLTTGGSVTLEKAVLTVRNAFNVSVSDFNMPLPSPSAPPLPTAGTLTYTLTPFIQFVMVVSSTDPAYKGGKLVVSCAFSRTKTINIPNAITTIMTNLPATGAPTQEQLDAILGTVIDNVNSIMINVNVYDNNNESVYFKSFSVGEIYSAIPLPSPTL